MVHIPSISLFKTVLGYGTCLNFCLLCDFTSLGSGFYLGVAAK